MHLTTRLLSGPLNNVHVWVLVHHISDVHIFVRRNPKLALGEMPDCGIVANAPDPDFGMLDYSELLCR